MNSVYYILEQIRDHIRNNGVTNEVSFGDLTEIDLAKTTIFPIVHLDIENVTVQPQIIEFNLLVLSMGIVDNDHAEEAIDEFFGGNNLHDTYNTQLWVLADLCEALRRGDLWDDHIKLITDPIFEPFERRFEGQLAGWGGNITIQMKNDVKRC